MWNVTRLQELLDYSDPDTEMDEDDYELYGGNYYEVEEFENDLQHIWEHSEHDDQLFWLATAVGIDEERIVCVACAIIEKLFEPIDNAGWEQGQVLEAVKAWEECEQARKGGDRLTWDSHILFEILRFGAPFPPVADQAASASDMLASLVTVLPSCAAESPSLRPSGLFARYAADFIRQLTFVQADLQQAQPELDRQNKGESTFQFIDFIRQQIPFPDVLVAARRTGIWLA